MPLQIRPLPTHDQVQSEDTEARKGTPEPPRGGKQRGTESETRRATNKNEYTISRQHDDGNTVQVLHEVPLFLLL